MTTTASRPRKAREREQCADRDSDDGRKQDRAQADQQRQAHDREQAGVAAEHQLKRGFTSGHWRAITSGRAVAPDPLLPGFNC